jgi:ribokinase
MRSAVLGHVEWMTFGLVDRVPASGEIAHSLDWWEEPAGGGAVAAVQLQRLTGRCTFFTALGKDAVGKRAHLELKGRGLRAHVAWRPAQTRRGFTFIEASGERTITTLGERLHARAGDPLPWDELEEIDCVYVCAADPGALRLARRARVVVATSRVAGLLAEAAVRLDAVVGSSSDPSERFDPADLPDPPGVVVRTDGRRGGSFETVDGRAGRFDAVEPPGPLVDTYGAGDTFAAGLTFALGRGDDIEEAVSVAARCGAWCVAGRGPYGRSLGADDV